MPLYDFKCNRCDSLTTELMKMSEDKTNIKCKAKLDCDGTLEQQFDMVSKPLVADRDLMYARTHTGKKY